MSPNGNHKRRGTSEPDENKSSDLTMIIVLAMICSTVLGVVWIVWG